MHIVNTLHMLYIYITYIHIYVLYIRKQKAFVFELSVNPNNLIYCTGWLNLKLSKNDTF